MFIGRLYTELIKTFQIKYQCPICFWVCPQSLKHTDENKAISEMRRIDTEARKQNRKARWFMQYHEYLESDAWKEKRQAILERDGFTCQRCAAPAEVVHHVCYWNLFNEEPEDLISLCSDCHDILHQNTIDKY